MVKGAPKPSQAEDRNFEPLCAAAGSVALLLALNKPVYPLYVWFLAGSAFQLSLLTAVSMPAYLAVWYLARCRRSFSARLGMVVAGTADAIIIALVLGRDSGALLFLFPAIMLAGQLFYVGEKWFSRVLIGLGFVALVALYEFSGGPLELVDALDLTRLYTLNISGAAALAAFIALRMPKLGKPG